ncbi:hypothetical protein BJY04DRAFT_228404 [Aspergillus karnatakaensis]|uniref:uncharacterized protein n=1 Tax=Aspergillus karnatakaensis TaxID=1810916 RepID=UPI003CCD7805
MDHEISGAQEWELPGYGVRKSVVRQAAAATAPQKQQPLPKPTNPELEIKPTPTVPAKPGSPPKTNAPIQGSTGSRGRGGGRGMVVAGPSQARRLFKNSPSRMRWEKEDKPDSEFVETAKSMGYGKEFAPNSGVLAVVRDISKRTDTNVKRPWQNERAIQIWGEPKQVAAAEKHLKDIIAKCTRLNNRINVKPQDPDKRKPKDQEVDKWRRINAYSTTKEAKTESVEKGEFFMSQLRQPPEPNISFPEQLFFLWPTNGPSLTDYLGPQLESLDLIRAQYGCHVFVPKDLPGHICALGHDHNAMKEMAERIRALWVEAMAKTNVKTKLYLVEPPVPSKMKNKIIVNKENQLHKPVLRGSHLKGSELQLWQDRYALILSQNKSRIVAAVEECLKSITFVRGHLRLRVNLGTFCLDTYPTPDNEKWYGFEEFGQILRHEQTKCHLFPGLKVGQADLLQRCSQASHLFEPCDNASTSLESVRPTYSVNFEFLGADKSMLRMEAEFTKASGAREYAATERRWLRPRVDGQFTDMRPPLHVAVVDFERSDWQIELKSFDFHQASTIDTALREFSHKIGFNCPEELDNMSAKPKRKVTFPSEPAVSRLVEKTALRFRLKGTQYIFEIARYDEYKRNNTPIGTGMIIGGGGLSEVPYTSWGASIFLPAWDNLLGAHANLPLGRIANYAPSLAKFFPSSEPLSTPEDQAKGFWKFVDLVKQAAGLLGPGHTPPINGDSDAAPDAGTSTMKTSSSKEATAPVNPSSSLAGSPRLIHTDLGTLF